MSHYRISKEDVLKATEGGLKVILLYYPDAEDCIGKAGKKFKMHEEKTPSASIKMMPDGNYVVADFGADGKWMNAIVLCQKEENLDYGGAIKHIAEHFKVGGDDAVKSMFEPAISVTDADPGQDEGEKIIDDVFEEIPEAHLNILFSEKTFSYVEYIHHNIAIEEDRKKAVYDHLRKICTGLHYFALKSYTIIKKRKAIKIASTDYYPIFLIHERSFQKIYQPNASNKGHRFMYVGKFDQNFLHGYDQAIQAYNDKNATAKKDISAVADPEKSAEIILEKLNEIIYCTGGSDALNLRALGYNVVWPSSEYYKLGPTTVKKFFELAKDFLTCPDLDPTGEKQNHRLCMDERDDIFLDIKTISLPKDLQLKKYKGNFCKDVRDFLRYYTSKELRQLVKTALPYRFWDIEIGRNNKGEMKTKFGRPVYEYKPNNVRMYKFLMNNGFFRYKIDKKTNVEVFIHIENNIVKKVEANDIKNFIHYFFEKRHMNEDLRNTFYKSNQLNELSLSTLDVVDIDFTDYEKKSQFFFFENATWKITPEGIESSKPGDLNRKVWQDEVIPHQVKKLDPMFQITHNELTETYDIDIKDESCLFFRYLINASRIHWRKELEEKMKGMTFQEQEEYRKLHKYDIAGPKLTTEEQQEQKLHLINKIYSLGYLLHRYKDPSRPWAIFAMDNKISDDGLSHGGSGKSIAYKAVRYFMESVTFDGRDSKLFDDKHLFENVNKHTDYMLFDDANNGFQFNRLFSLITGEMNVNPKGKTRYELAFQDVPKIVVTSNFTPTEISPTTLRRLLFTVFGDYYHHENNGEYNETRGPMDDFGKNLFFDFDEKEWNLFCNFMSQCCMSFMNFGKIEPPMGNVMKRNMQNYMGQSFLRWADVYFGEEAGRRDAWVIRKMAMDDFIRETNLNGWSTQAFTSRLVMWCKYKGIILDPAELLNSDGRLVKTLPEFSWDNREKRWTKTGNKKTSEMIYLHTPEADLTDKIIMPGNDDEVKIPYKNEQIITTDQDEDEEFPIH
jgi:hypothetical protein